MQKNAKNDVQKLTLFHKRPYNFFQNLQNRKNTCFIFSCFFGPIFDVKSISEPSFFWGFDMSKKYLATFFKIDKNRKLQKIHILICQF
jgi:hypothetical protein